MGRRHIGGISVWMGKDKRETRISIFFSLRLMYVGMYVCMSVCMAAVNLP